MHMGAFLVREGDKKVFQVTMLAHWSDIRAKDGETDSVKWYGPGYVSANKGHTYRIATNEETSL